MDAVSDEKQQQAMHRALKGMTAAPVAPTEMPTAAPIAPPSIPSMPGMNPMAHKYFPKTVGSFGAPKMMADGGEVKKDDDKKDKQGTDAPTGQWVVNGTDPDRRKAAAASLGKAFGMTDGGVVKKNEDNSKKDSDEPKGQWAKNGGDPDKLKEGYASMAKAFGGFAHGGEVPVNVSPGEKYLAPAAAHAAALGSHAAMAQAHKFPGHAAVPGDSFKNDTIPTHLEAGGVVVPRSVAETGDSQILKDFIANALKKK